MRRMVYDFDVDDAPGEVWLGWSVKADGSDPVLEDDFLRVPDDMKFRPVRYVRADLYTTK